MTPEFKEGQRILICVESWAGRTRSPVEILKVCPKRYKVRWLEAAIGHHAGHESYVPHWSAVAYSETNA